MGILTHSLENSILGEFIDEIHQIFVRLEFPSNRIRRLCKLMFQFTRIVRATEHVNRCTKPNVTKKKPTKRKKENKREPNRQTEPNRQKEKKREPLM